MSTTAPSTPTMLADLISIAHAMVDIYEQRFERLDTRLAMAKLSKRARDVLGRGCPDVKPDSPCRAADVELAENDICPRCGGELDTGWECNSCKFDARYLIERSDAPSRTWLRKMADGEDAAGGQISVGGMAADLGATDEEVDALIAEMESGSEAGDAILSTIANNLGVMAEAYLEGGEKMPAENSPLVEVARFERDLEDISWNVQLHKTLDRVTPLDELGFLPEHFKPGTVVVVLEPR